MSGDIPTLIGPNGGALVVPALEEAGSPGGANVQEDILDAIPLHAMMVRSRMASRPDVVEAERNVVGNEYTEDLGSDFRVPVSSKKVNLEALVKEFGLPDKFEYLLPRDGDSTCTPSPRNIMVYVHMLRAGFRISPFSF